MWHRQRYMTGLAGTAVVYLYSGKLALHHDLQQLGLIAAIVAQQPLLIHVFSISLLLCCALARRLC